MSELPPRLRVELERGLEPVRPLSSPGRRVLWLLPFVALAIGGVPLAFQLRPDVERLGAALAWGGSALQAALGLWLLACALRQSIPGCALPVVGLWWRASCALAAEVALTLVTFLASPSDVPAAHALLYFRVCATQPFLLGLVPLGAAGLLLVRGLVTHPIATGMLAGLGSGLLVDSGWRLYCAVSHPAHVLATHTLDMLALAGLAALIGLAQRARQRRSAQRW